MGRLFIFSRKQLLQERNDRRQLLQNGLPDRSDVEAEIFGDKSVVPNRCQFSPWNLRMAFPKERGETAGQGGDRNQPSLSGILVKLALLELFPGHTGQVLPGAPCRDQDIQKDSIIPPHR